MSDWAKIVLITLCIAIPLVFIISLISYYISKWLAKWIKNVQRIDNRQDLDKSPKLKEIVRIVRTVSQVYRIKMPEVGVYPSREINAFATGPSGNTLIAFSSNLVNTMNMSEIKGVVGHELSHLIHNDIRRILLVQGIFDVLYWVFAMLLAWFLFAPSEKEEKGIGWFFKWILKMILFQILCAIIRLIGIFFVLWYNRRRELAADLRGAKIVGVDNMLATLRKLLELENKAWIVDGIDLTEDDKQQDEPNSISLLKFNPAKKKRGILDWFRTHPPLEDRIARLEALKESLNSTGTVI